MSTIPQHIRELARAVADGAEDVGCLMALADEIKGYVDEPEGFKSRKTLEHESKAIAKAAWEVARNPYVWLSTNGGTMRELARVLVEGRPPKFIVSVDDPSRMTCEELLTAAEALFAAIRNLGGTVETQSFRDGSVRATATLSVSHRRMVDIAFDRFVGR